MGHDDNRSTAFASGVLGALIGAAAAAVTMIMMDNDKRAKVMEKASNLKDDVNSAIDTAKNKAKSAMNLGQEKTEDFADKAERATDRASRRLTRNARESEMEE